MESFNQWPQLGDAGENNHGPEPESARKKKKCPQNKLKRSSLFFCDTFAFLQPISAHTHTLTCTEVGGRGRTSLAAQLPSTTAQPLLRHHLFTEKTSVQSFLE